MSEPSATAPARPLAREGLAPIPAREIMPWAVLFGALMLMLMYFVGAEAGATSLISSEWVHEFVHDGRHLLGFPCH